MFCLEVSLSFFPLSRFFLVSSETWLIIIIIIIKGFKRFRGRTDAWLTIEIALQLGLCPIYELYDCTRASDPLNSLHYYVKDKTSSSKPVRACSVTFLWMSLHNFITLHLLTGEVWRRSAYTHPKHFVMDWDSGGGVGWGLGSAQRT